jgi:hypothetical protein
MPRCPKGTRKNKQGICEKINKGEPEKEGDKKAEEKEDQEEETLESCIQKCTETHRDKTPTPVKTPSPSPKVRRNTQKRCPKGQHRNKEGECVPKKLKKSIKMVESSASVSSISAASSASSKKSPLISRLESADTPRKVYAREYLNHPIQLLGKKMLLHISFPNPEQFINYKKITGEEQTGDECFIQSLFTLGLRDRKAGKQDLEEIKKHNIGGISFKKAATYLEKSFGLEPGKIVHSWENKDFKTNIEFKDDIYLKLRTNLANNHSTIISLGLKNTKTNVIGGHFMIVYKYNKILHFFDPQSNGDTTDASKIFLAKNILVINYGLYYTKQIEKTMDLIDNTCQLDYTKGGNKK